METVDSVARGETVCSPRFAFQVFSRVAALSGSRADLALLESTDLTLREVEVLRLLRFKLSNREIADRLGVSLHTVKNHVRGVLRKLGAHTRSEAVASALPALRSCPDQGPHEPSRLAG